MIEGHDYTIYSNRPGGRSRMYALLALITAFITPLAQHGFLVILRRYFGDDWDLAETALFFGGFTALILFGMLINFFDRYLWRTRFGRWLFWLAGLPAPPDLRGEYNGAIELRSPTDPTAVFQTSYRMLVAQTWEQMSLDVDRASENGGRVRVHSDMASIQIGMLSKHVKLRFVYTFEESLPRREGTGMMNRQFSGAATFEFRQDNGAWVVDGHFFDDIGRSGQVTMRQKLPGPPALPAS